MKELKQKKEMNFCLQNQVLLINKKETLIQSFISSKLNLKEKENCQKSNTNADLMNRRLKKIKSIKEGILKYKCQTANNKGKNQINELIDSSNYNNINELEETLEFKQEKSLIFLR